MFHAFKLIVANGVAWGKHFEKCNHVLSCSTQIQPPELHSYAPEFPLPLALVNPRPGPPTPTPHPFLPLSQVVQKNVRGRAVRNNVKRRADAARASLRVDAGELQRHLSMRELPMEPA